MLQAGGIHIYKRQTLQSREAVSYTHLEVNQMGSGIAAQAIENHARTILSNTKCFQEFGTYYPNCFSTFDIGNYMELADRIVNFEDKYDDAIECALKEHNIEKNVQEYMRIFER